MMDEGPDHDRLHLGAASAPPISRFAPGDTTTRLPPFVRRRIEDVMRIPTTIAVCSVLVAFVGRPHSRAGEAATRASLGASGASDWAKNGATACKKLLTADFLGAILASAPGESEPRPDGVSCGYLADSGLTNISIALSDHITLDSWEQFNRQQRPKDIALAGIGDKAIRSDDGTLIGSWKKGDRTCGVYLVPIREQPKLTGEALAKKLGVLCNQLFAMP